MQKLTLTAEERQNVRFALRAHPDILEHVESLSQVSRLPKSRLIDILHALGIDLDDAKTGRFVARRHEAAEDHGIHDHPFSGALEYDIDIRLAGRDYRHTLIVDYISTPEWPYFDAETQSERIARAGSMTSYHLSRRKRPSSDVAAPDARRIERRKKYPHTNEVRELFPEFFGQAFDDALFDRIDEEMLRDNAALRKAYANVVPLRAFSPSVTVEAQNVIDLVDQSLAAIGKAIRIAPCDDHWHPVMIDLNGHELDQELEFRSDAQSMEGAKYDLYWAIATDIQGKISDHLQND